MVTQIKRCATLSHEQFKGVYDHHIDNWGHSHLGEFNRVIWVIFNNDGCIIFLHVNIQPFADRGCSCTSNMVF